MGHARGEAAIRAKGRAPIHFGCWNFLYPKSALNLTLQMQACCYQECGAQQDAKNPAGYRRAAIGLIHDNQEP